MADHPIVVSVASRPYPGERVNGDAHAVHWTGAAAGEGGNGHGRCRIAVIDGLGHGPEAAAAAACAVSFLDEHPDLDPAEALRRSHVAMMGTRGAAISIARLDLD